jgi:hypothetical protein
MLSPGCASPIADTSCEIEVTRVVVAAADETAARAMVATSRLRNGMVSSFVSSRSGTTSRLRAARSGGCV